MGHWPVLGHRRSGHKPVLLFQIPCCRNLSGLSSALFLSFLLPSVDKSSPLCKIKFAPIILSLLMGNLWARYVPKVSLFGISLNPGPFTVKEHVIIYIMSAIGASPAYAVSVTPVSQIISTLSHQFFSDQHHCRPKGFLQSTSQLWLSVSFSFASPVTVIRVSDRFLVAKNRSVAACHVDPANWILDRWYLQADPRGSTVHDLAGDSRGNCAVQHVALPGDIRYPFIRRYFPCSFLHIYFRRLHRIQSVFLSWKESPLNVNWLLH